MVQSLASAEALIENAKGRVVFDAVSQRAFKVRTKSEVECDQFGHVTMLGAPLESTEVERTLPVAPLSNRGVWAAASPAAMIELDPVAN